MSKITRAASDPSAPAEERYDAQAELQGAHYDRTEVAGLTPLIKEIYDELSRPRILKANTNVVPFPSKNMGNDGMQSVYMDEWQIPQMGDYLERPGVMDFSVLRNMVEQTPILNAVVLTRVRQVQAFCRIQETREGAGFVIRHQDSDHQIDDAEQRSINLLQQFVTNCGWEFNPRKRRRLRRDNMRTFLAKLTRDSLSMDSAAIETEYKNDRSLGLDGLYAVDGATIRLCPEDGYRGDEDIFALQVVQGRISTAYGYEDLIYEARNPRSDVASGGYGISETELLVRVVTGFLNAMTMNIKGFSDNAIPKGMLHLTGEYSEGDLLAFKRYWNAMVKGVDNNWALPMMVSKDQESKASFESFGADFSEMYFSKWMTFLASIICAVYGISPDEINFESFSASKSALSGSDTAERLADSKDKGLKPLLGYFESIYTDFIVQEFGEKWAFRWTGIDEVDQDKEHELKKTVLTVNEIRAQEGYPPLEAAWGDAPVDPSLSGIWMQMQQGQQEGAEGAEGAPGQEEGAPGGGEQDMDGDDQHPDYENEDTEDDETDAGDRGEGDGEDQEEGGKKETLRKADDFGEVPAGAGDADLLKANPCRDPETGEFCSFGERSGLENISSRIVDIPLLPEVNKLSADDLRTKAISVLKKWPSNGVLNKDTGWNFVVSKQDWKKLAKWKGQSIDALKMLVSGVDGVASSAVLSESHADQKGNSAVSAVHRFYCPVVMGGKSYLVKLTVKDYILTNGKNRKNLHALESVEIINPSESPALEEPPRTHPSAQALGSTLNIVDLLQNVQRSHDGKPFFSGAGLEKSLSPDEEWCRAESENVQSLLKANQQGVGVDDEIFYNHPDHGVGSGKVVAFGADGCTVAHESGSVGVPWDSFLGHKKRADRGYDVVDHGDSGVVLKDRVTGKHHFVGNQAADKSEGEGSDKDAEDESDPILKKK